MKTINKKQLIELLMTVKGSQFASITAFVGVDVYSPVKNGLDDGKGKSGVKSVSKYLLSLNADYGNALVNQANREGKTDLAETIKNEIKTRTWGTHLYRSDGSAIPLVEHNGNYYLTAHVRKYINKPLFFLRGKRVSADSIREFIKEHKKSTTQKDLDGEVKHRDIAIDNIRSIAIGGEIYKIKG